MPSWCDLRVHLSCLQAGGLSASLAAQLSTLQEEEAQWLMLQDRYQAVLRPPVAPEVDSSGAAERKLQEPTSAEADPAAAEQGAGPVLAEGQVTLAAAEGVTQSCRELTGLGATRRAVQGSMMAHVSR